MSEDKRPIEEIYPLPGDPKAKRAMRKRHFTVGDFDIVVTGPADAELKFEHRHNYVQMAAGDGQLRESGTQVVREIVREVAGNSNYPSGGAPTDNVLSDAGLLASTPGAELIQNENDARGAAQHLRAVADSIGGF